MSVESKRKDKEAPFCSQGGAGTVEPPAETGIAEGGLKGKDDTFLEMLSLRCLWSI